MKAVAGDALCLHCLVLGLRGWRQLYVFNNNGLCHARLVESPLQHVYGLYGGISFSSCINMQYPGWRRVTLLFVQSRQREGGEEEERRRLTAVLLLYLLSGNVVRKLLCGLCLSV